MSSEVEALSREILQRAAEEMEERGYCRWMLENSEGNLCVLGALIKAVAKIAERIGNENLARWSNDADGPTVIRTLREVASQD